MPQELHVVRCYSCEIFQVHIVKKIPKWECKVCGEKQSLKKVYGRGTGKDCRLLVQEFNQKRLEISEAQNINSSEETCINQDDLQNVNHFNVECFNSQTKSDKWAEFICESDLIPKTLEKENDDGDIGESSMYTFERPIKKRKCLQKKKREEQLNNIDQSATLSENCRSDEPCSSVDIKVASKEIFFIQSHINISHTDDTEKPKYNKRNTFMCENKHVNNNESRIIEDSKFSNHFPFEHQQMDDKIEKDLKNNKWSCFIQDSKGNDDENNRFESTMALTSLKGRSKDVKLQKKRQNSKWNEFIFKDEDEEAINEKQTDILEKDDAILTFNTQENDLDTIFTF